MPFGFPSECAFGFAGNPHLFPALRSLRCGSDGRNGLRRRLSLNFGNRASWLVIGLLLLVFVPMLL